MRFSNRVAIALLAMLTLLPFSAFAGTTGNLFGVVTDASGAALPGVTVTVTSPQMQGSRSAVTNEKGEYNLQLLPPGTYRAEYALGGFDTVVKDNTKVSLDQSTRQDATMAMGAVAEAITVTAEAVVVDPTQTTVQQNFGTQHLKYAAIGGTGRDYLSVIAQTPGAVGSGNAQVMGANAGQNNFTLDGVNTTDPVTHTFGSNLPFDAIQEMSVQTLGKDAEYGRAVGGAINVVTKSGGNNFSGTFDVRYRDENFFESGDHFDPDARPQSYFKPAASLGGPILRDRLWFFGTVDRPDTKVTNPNINGFTPGSRTFQGWNSLGKLTFTPMSNHTLQLFITDNRATVDNSQNSSFYRPEADSQQTQESTIYNLGYDVILNPQWLANFRVGVRRGYLETAPMNGDVTLPGIYNQTTGVYSQSYTNWQYGDRDRDELIASTSYFLEAAGSHTLKAGINLDQSNFNSYNNYTGTALGNTLCTEANGFKPGATCGMFIRTRNTAAGNDLTYYAEVYSIVPEKEVSGNYNAIYLQDEWHPISSVTARLGLRYEQSKFDVPGRDDVPTLDAVQPRIGLAWDIFNNASTIAHGFWGEVMDDNALTLANFGTLAGSSELTRIFYTASTGKFDRFIDHYGSSDPNIYDPNLKPTISTEAQVGVTQRLWRNTSLDVTGVWRKSDNMFEDTCYPADSCDIYEMTNNPGGDPNALRSEYQGIVTKIEARPYSWLSGLVSYVYSESKGSVEYTQNQGGDFDILPYHAINTFGYLSDDARHRVKASGFVRVPWGSTIGLDYSYRTGVPDNITVATSATAPYFYGSIFAIPRGDRRVPSLQQLDLQYMHEFNIAGTRLGLVGVVYNLFGSETVTDLGSSVGAYTGCATVNAEAASAKKGDCIANPLYGIEPGAAKGLSVSSSTLNTEVNWQTPRRYELGLRFEF